ncbi:hypothetical protein Arno162_56 [Pectobacterium phage Arno162]|uniref:Uncharacterized protein n=2 Tax=Arnovirus TaxID=3425109 RepID=A0A678ZXG4_9CAUD|nr:hypothetical protein Arno162_56 [Pectobacterium phage Arno162]AZV02243.1 hypothetical protein Arno18_57 [Pectobacterium phage Arno18]
MVQVSGKQIVDELKGAGFQAGVAVATNAEVEAKAACGQVAFDHSQQDAMKIVRENIGVSL